MVLFTKQDDHQAFKFAFLTNWINLIWNLVILRTFSVSMFIITPLGFGWSGFLLYYYFLDMTCESCYHKNLCNCFGCLLKTFLRPDIESRILFLLWSKVDVGPIWIFCHVNRQQFLEPGESVIMISMVKKLQKLSSKKVQLILTNKPKLIYVDPSKLVVKGNIIWSDNPNDLNIQVSSPSNFKICTVWFSCFILFVANKLFSQYPLVESWLNNEISYSNNQLLHLFPTILISESWMFPVVDTVNIITHHFIML